jgi:hypothetical protein
MAMWNRERMIVAALASAMLIAVGSVFLYSHRQALFGAAPAAQQTAAAETDANPNGLNIPPIDEMCKAAGATEANMKACQTEESDAAEFVIAWMGLNNFINNGSIDLEQIQLQATFPDPPDPGLGLGLDPSLDPNADPNDPGEPNIDPATGEIVTDSFGSAAEIALFCLSESNDWLKMHECISRYDPTSRFDGVH